MHWGTYLKSTVAAFNRNDLNTNHANHANFLTLISLFFKNKQTMLGTMTKHTNKKEKKLHKGRCFKNSGFPEQWDLSKVVSRYSNSDNDFPNFSTQYHLYVCQALSLYL